jgi:hypothetical protein
MISTDIPKAKNEEMIRVKVENTFFTTLVKPA